MEDKQGVGAPPAVSLGAGLILLLALLTGLDAMAIDMYLPAMPALGVEFSVPAGRIQQTLSIFLVGLAVGQALYGPLLDRYGRRWPLLVGVALFVAGSALAAVAPSVEWLLVARFLQAIGAAAGLVTPRAIVADLCNLTESARIFSLLMQVMMIAPIVAPLLGGYILTHGDWRMIFWVLAGLGVAGWLWGLRQIPDSLAVEQRIQLNVRTVWQAYLQQMRSPVFMAYTLAGGFILGSLFSYISSSAFIFTQHFTLTPTQYSYLFAVNSVALVLSGQLSNRMLSAGITEKRVMAIGMITHASAGVVLYAVVYAGLATLWVYFALLAIAIGALGMVFGNLTALTMNEAGPQTGTASALMGTWHYLLSAVIGYVFSFAAAGPEPLPLTIAVCGVLAWLCSNIAQRIKPVLFD